MDIGFAAGKMDGSKPGFEGKNILPAQRVCVPAGRSTWL
jgi:hypothetical protein